MEDLKDTVVVLEGKRYEIKQVDKPLDVSKEFESEAVVEHMILGFDEPLYMVEETDDDGDIAMSFHFAVTESDHGKLMVSVQDEEVIDKAIQIVYNALEGGQLDDSK